MLGETTLRRLGWPLIIESLAGRCRTSMGARSARALRPLPDRAAVIDRLEMVEEVRRVHESGESFPVGGVPDVEVHLSLAEKIGVLDGPALREVASLLRGSADVAHFLDRHAALLPSVREGHPGLGGAEKFARRIEAAIDPSGELTDDASPELAKARSRVRELHGTLRRSAEALLEEAEWKERLQESYFTVRGDRYVLPVKAAFRYQVGGIVHNVSNTGQTVFIEPPGLIQTGNDLAIATAEASEAERRVLIELTTAVRTMSEKIRRDAAQLGAIDLLDASAKLAHTLGAIRPEMPEDPTAPIELRALRHPILLLQGKEVVPNDLAVRGRTGCLVVTGPNAGGKTVTVSAVALCAALVRHGLPIPAGEGSSLPLSTDLFAVIGDGQDLERGLSTFTAHLHELKRLLEEARPGVLIVVDEICADTDPREGAALAIAILESLLDAGARVLVTTHLAALKALASTDDRFMSAAMGFDLERMTPTFELKLEASAGSSALEVARGVGLSSELVARAREHMSGEGSKLSDALDALEAATAQAQAAEREAQNCARAAREQEARLESERTRLTEARSRVRKEGRLELLAEIEAARADVKQLIAKLQAAPTIRQAGATKEKIEAIGTQTRMDLAKDEEREASPAHENDARVVVGGFVRVPSMNDKEGEVLELSDTDALVQLGALKMRVELDELIALRGPPTRTLSPKLKDMRPSDPVDDAPPEVIDLRGSRVEEGLVQLERQLDRLLAADASRAVIIHGHGTGAMKRAVRDYLRSAAHVTEARPGEGHEGGDGVTVVTLG